jgi:hypothetical protein
MANTSTIEELVTSRNFSGLHQILMLHSHGRERSSDASDEARAQLSCVLSLVERDLGATHPLVSTWIEKTLALDNGENILFDVLRSKIEDVLCIAPDALEASDLELQSIYLAQRFSGALSLESHQILFGSSHYRTILADAVDVNAYYFVDEMLRFRRALKDDQCNAPPSVARVWLKHRSKESIEQYDLLQYAALMGDERMIDLVRSHVPQGCNCAYLSMGEQVLRHLGLAGNRPALRSYTDDGAPMLVSHLLQDHISAFDCAMRYIDAGAKFADGPSAWQKISSVNICESQEAKTLIPLEYAIQKSTTYADMYVPKKGMDRLISRIEAHC